MYHYFIRTNVQNRILFLPKKKAKLLITYQQFCNIDGNFFSNFLLAIVFLK